MTDFASTIYLWYTQNARKLPWRETREPYLIWISEVILQQTRVDQGMAYYYHFAKNYPTVEKLASATEEQILKSWQGLGYYSRARNLHATAQNIVKEYKGKFPATYSGLLQLKGIGPYTAAAISSFAYREKKAVVDGNVSRVISRYFGIEEPIDSTTGKKLIQAIADDHIPEKRPDLYNQSIMEFGALQCTPKNPNCRFCPLQSGCFAFRHKKVDLLPIKGKKTKVSSLFMHYFFVHDSTKYFIRKRGSDSIWKNMYELPCTANEKESKTGKLHIDKNWKIPASSTIRFDVAQYKHQLSHRTIYAQFSEIRLSGKFKPPQGWNGVALKKMPDVAIPRLIERFLEEHFSSYGV
ncbi:MAG: A/G-specific adenine glycosylase [Flavobacteriales bacterium]